MIKRAIKIYPKNQFENIRRYYEDKEIEIASAVDLNLDFKKILETNSTKYLVDISSWSESLFKQRERIFDMECLINSYSEEVQFICSDDCLIYVKDVFKHTFVKEEILEGSTERDEATEQPMTKIKTIVDLSSIELDELISYISTNLVGHKKFKEGLKTKLQSFKLFNKLGEQKIFSMFLMGESGIGKTEVGRLFHKAMKSKERLCKISFGNYSSKDSLNSLIGSPRGYMGSETGELPLGIQRTDIGVILIDEFEKADNPVFNFFLDMLEEGKFTDSLSNTYDLDGYVIIFTSNLKPKDYYKRISPELRSRFDYVCEFQLLSDEDKKSYMYKRIESTISKFEERIGKSITQEDKQFVFKINYAELNNLRKINRAIKDKFAEISSKYI